MNLLFLTFIVNSVYMKVRVKQSLYWLGLALTVPRFTNNRHMKFVRLSALMHRLPLPPGDICGTYFCQRPCRPQGHSAAGRIKSMKNSSYTMGDKTRILPACSAEPQQTTLSRAQNSMYKSLRIHNAWAMNIILLIFLSLSVPWVCHFQYFLIAWNTVPWRLLM
jgi:hypothetical protein